MEKMRRGGGFIVLAIAAAIVVDPGLSRAFSTRSAARRRTRRSKGPTTARAPRPRIRAKALLRIPAAHPSMEPTRTPPRRALRTTPTPPSASRTSSRGALPKYRRQLEPGRRHGVLRERRAWLSRVAPRGDDVELCGPRLRGRRARIPRRDRRHEVVGWQNRPRGRGAQRGQRALDRLRDRQVLLRIGER